MALPIMNFPVFNPVKTGLQEGRDMYSAVNQGIAQQLQNQMMREKMPYVGQQEAASLQKTQAEIQRDKAMAGLSSVQSDLARAQLPTKEAEAAFTKKLLELGNQLGIYDMNTLKDLMGFKAIDVMSGIDDGSGPLFEGPQQQGIPQPGQQSPGGGQFQPAISTPQGNIPLSSFPPEMLNDAISKGLITPENIVNIPNAPSQPEAMAGGVPAPAAAMESAGNIEPVVEGYNSDKWSSYLPPEMTLGESLKKNFIENQKFKIMSPAQQKAAEERAKVQADNQAKSLEKFSDTASVSYENLQELRKLKESRDKLGTFSKGSFFGQGPATRNEAQKFQKSYSRLLNNMINQAGASNVSKDILNSMKAALPSITLRDDAFNEVHNYLVKAEERNLEKLDFYNHFYERGASKAEADSAWLKYSIDNPLAEPGLDETGENKKFLGGDKKGHVRMRDPNGVVRFVPEDQIDLWTNRGGTLVK